MSLNDLLSPAKCVVPDSSVVYDDLVDFIKTRYNGKYTGDIQAFIFAAAYTQYSQRKKKNISRSYVAGTGAAQIRDNKTAIRNVISDLKDPNVYEDLCKEAEAVFTQIMAKINAEVHAVIVKDILAELPKIVAPIKNEVALLPQNIIKDIKRESGRYSVADFRNHFVNIVITAIIFFVVDHYKTQIGSTFSSFWDFFSSKF